MRVRAFFNDAIGGSVRDNAESQARLDATRGFASIKYNPYADGYDPKRAVLVESMLSPMNMSVAGDDFAACEQVFYLMNRDERENGQYERSLSVGDVVAVEDRFYAVADMGFVRVDEVLA